MRKKISLFLVFVIIVSCFTVTTYAKNVSNEQLEEYSRMLGGVDIVGISPLEPSDPDFYVTFYDENHKTPLVSDANPNPDVNFVPQDEKLELPQVRTTANTLYDVYNSSGILKSNDVVSLFRAIILANTTGDYVKETDTGVVVFTKTGSENTFYKFQFTNYYGITDAAGAASWVNDYRYAHVVDGTGRLRYNSYYSIKGVPDAFALEPESGGYYYKFSYSYYGHKASYNKVVFSNSDIKFSNDYVNNAYVYSAVVNSQQTLEAGIMSSKELNGDWYVYGSDEAGLVNWYPNKKVIDSALIGTNTYRSSGEVEIKISVKDGGATGVVTSDILGETAGTISLTGNTFSSSGNVTFLQACSLVQIVKTMTSDIRNGTYLKNVSFKNCKLHNNADCSDTGYDFYGNSNNTYYSFIYNDDCITYTRNNTTTESVNIDYSVGYQS